MSSSYSSNKKMNENHYTEKEVEQDSGVEALVLIARYHKIAADSQQIRHLSGSGKKQLTDGDLILAARTMGLKSRKVTVRPERLAKTPFPALALDRLGRHFIVTACDGDRVLVLEPDAGKPTVILSEVLWQRCNGDFLLFASRASLTGELAKFDFTWFIPAIVKYRKILLEVFFVSALIQLFGLVSPLMFQVVMDKVLVNNALSTLNVVCIGLLVSGIAEVLLTGLRNYVFSHTTNRMDVELGSRIFRHILALPVGYYATRRVGDTVARVKELENIRNFLTGQALTAIIDSIFSVVFVAVMCLYSIKLTLIVLLSLPVYVIITTVIIPAFRRRLNEKYARGADNQSFLVETVSAIETVKSSAVEPLFIRQWDNLLAGYVAASFRVSNLGNIGQQLVQFVGKIVTILTLFLGAKLVISGTLSVGALIAFNMMSQRVSAPILRLAQLWQDFQQVGISMQRLGDILNTRTENLQGRNSQPSLKGAIRFENVRFRYKPEAPAVLNNISFDIEPGKVIGVVGRSGSGKSTLTKLIQRLYLPESGRVWIDGTDIALADPSWLRRQIGVVLQENILFGRSIRENIALADPGISLESVINAAKLAGAHDFISEMSEGYDTRIGEHGSGLSGGQRQRIAIARALITNPRILIFDEATSALDFETERVIHKNMQAICQGRTVIIIAHRLTAVRNADTILVMEKGLIVEQGNHSQLIEENGLYSHLVSLQHA